VAGSAHDEATDLAWVIGSAEVFHLLRRVRGWEPDRYREWLTSSLANALLARE
jgi:hypothetical protein